MIHLDHLASTPVHPEVVDAMRPWLEGGRHGNPSHHHQTGLGAAEALEQARIEAAALIGSEPDEIVFTSGGTESANTALCGWAWRHPGGTLIVSSAEHPAILHTVDFLERQGHPVLRLPVDARGRIDPDTVQSIASSGEVLFAFHLSNHDSGAVQDVAALTAAAREKGWATFCDASTGGGWVPVQVNPQEIDFLSLAPRQFFGPQGVGVLFIRRGQALEPLMHGGRQEGGRRAGTENVAGIAGAGAACRLIRNEGPGWVGEVTSLRDRLWSGLRGKVPDIQLHGPAPGPERDPRHLAVGIAGVEGEALMLLLDLRGVTVTAGSGCLSGGEKYSHVLRAMGVVDVWVRGTLRLSPGPGQTVGQMDEAVEAIARAVAKLRAM
jgi:cysteine desulfurase